MQKGSFVRYNASVIAAFLVSLGELGSPRREN